MYLKKYWSKTVDVASVAISLMTFYIRAHKHSSLTLDTLTLAALVHNIGILPILTEAESHPDVFANPTFLQKAIMKLSGSIGGEVTKAWGFSEEFTMLVTSWSDLTVLPPETHYLDFIRAGAIYHGIFNNASTRQVLLKSYVKKGILPDVSFMDSDEFKNMVSDVKSLFT
ncbi:MAG: HDOD domain-containing protein [Colwellia sp.]